jgi:uncharacterized repeat protein (TIGR01451 family)
MKKFLLLLIFLFPSLLFAVIGQNGISIAPDGTLLKWEEGAWDFFIMHKTALEKSPENKAATLDENGNEVPGNPQGDTLIDQTIGTTYTLTSKHIPADADVDRAFLIWLADADPDNLDQPTKNSVTLTFTNSADPTLTYSQEVKSEFQGDISKNNKGVFQYEAVRVSVPVQLQKEPYCPGETAGYTGVYTYRVEVSDFMKKIIAMGEERGMSPGEALYGDYNVKGLESSDHCYYMKQSAMVAGWALPFVYTSSNIRAKKIYFYHGLEAYQHKAGEFVVNGFELPEDAVIRLGLVVFEGDPGLARTRVNGIAIPPEGLSISGHQNLKDYRLLANSCNPFKTQDSAGNAFNYTEIYNSISSIFGWDDETETCIGDPDNPESTENPIEYAIDADTFLVDSRFSPFDTMFNKGDMEFGLKIGSNQDQIFTNFLVVSVDTRPPQFDIPENRFTPNGREKDSCSCAKDPDTFCADRPFYYMIKVQNWGEDSATGVTLQDKLPFQVEYVSGTTEIATKINEEGLGTDWETIPDVDGKFPFEEPRVVADVLEHCRQSDSVCEQSAWIRFVVKPKANLAKNEVIKNTASITSNETAGAVFNTNSNIPLRLKQGACPAITECELPPKMECGGVKVDDPNFCNNNDDCKDGKKCIDNTCQNEPVSNLTSGAEVTFGEGINSPSNEGSAILITSPSEGIVLGQFYLLAESNQDKSYNFNEITLKFRADNDIEAKNFKLYKDNNGDGKVDSGDKEIASAEAPKSSYVKLAVSDPADRLTASGIKNHFIVTADALTNSESHPGKFNLVIEGSDSFNVSDSGSAKVSGAAIDFVEYRFEPAEGFIITKGNMDPKVPSYKDFNGEHEMLQVRTKSKGAADAVNSITLKTPNNYVKFGDGIKSVSLIIDKNKDGLHSAGEEVIAKISDFDNTSSIQINNLADLLKYEQDEEKFLVFKVEFSMSVGEKAKIQVSGVKVKSGNTVVELPVSSNEFAYECDKNDPNSCAGNEDDGGCAISELPESNNDTLCIVFALLAAMFAFAAAKVYCFRK